MSKPNLVIPNNFTTKALKALFFNIQNIFNNFSGQYLEDGTVTPDKLTGRIPVSLIGWPEYHVPLILTAQDYTTTSTTGDDVGGYFQWDSSKYPTAGGSWYFEASIASGEAATTCTAELHGASLVGSVSTQSTSLVRVRSAALTMPTGAVDLYCKVKTSNATYAATIASSRLIFVPS